MQHQCTEKINIYIYNFNSTLQLLHYNSIKLYYIYIVQFFIRSFSNSIFIYNTFTFIINTQLLFILPYKLRI